LVAATSASPSALPCAFSVPWALGAGQAMIVSSTISDGFPVTLPAAVIASYSAGTSSTYSLPPLVQSTTCTSQPYAS
jgi:hypothetical protein